MKFSFEFSLLNYSGYCSGVSYEQAVDHAKSKYLASIGIKVRTPHFYESKPKLPRPVLKFTPLQAQRLRELYRCAKDASLTEAEHTELQQLIHIARKL